MNEVLRDRTTSQSSSQFLPNATKQEQSLGQKIYRHYAWVSLLVCSTLYTAAASATTTGLPWEGPLQKILDSLTGPVAKILGVVAIVIAGFGIAFGEAGSGMRRIFQIVLGLSIAFTASSLVVSLFGFSGGVIF
jgi:type IV secretion system protein TrbC